MAAFAPLYDFPTSGESQYERSEGTNRHTAQVAAQLQTNNYWDKVTYQ